MKTNSNEDYRSAASSYLAEISMDDHNILNQTLDKLIPPKYESLRECLKIHISSVFKDNKPTKEDINNSEYFDPLKEALFVRDEEKRVFLNEICEAYLLLRQNSENLPSAEILDKFRELIKDKDGQIFIPFDPYRVQLSHFIAQAPISIEFIKIIYEQGGDLSAIDNGGNTPLLWGIANANNDLVAQFLDFASQRKANIGIDKQDSLYQNNSALHLAVAKGYDNKDFGGKEFSHSNLQIVEKLIAMKANPNIKNKSGLTALDLAVMRGNAAMVEAICKSSLLSNETIENAMQRVDQESWNNTVETNQILKTTCGFFKQVDSQDLSKDNYNKIKSNLEACLPKKDFEPKTNNPQQGKPKYVTCTIS